MEDEYVTMAEARELLGVSNFTMWKLVKDGQVVAYQSQLDRRKKLIRKEDVVALKTQAPRRIDPTDQQKKAGGWIDTRAA